MGFTLPSAGVTPAPSINRKMAKTPFCSQVFCVIQFFVSFRAKAAVAKNPGSSLPPASKLPATTSPAAGNTPNKFEQGRSPASFFLSLGAGVTPAEGRMKPTVGFILI
jgi:hypothetical protein